MKEFLLGLLDWIYKKKCYFCKSSKECSKMCSECFNEHQAEHHAIAAIFLNPVHILPPIFVTGLCTDEWIVLINREDAGE